jgi:hypothetical protein
MARKGSNDSHVETFHYETVRECLEPLRRKAARWTRDHRQGLASADPMPAAVHDRAQDIWQPLLGIADVAGNDWPERARYAARVLSGESRPCSESVTMQLLRDVRSIFIQKRAERLPTRDIIDALLQMADRPWAQWKGNTQLTPIRLAKILAGIGVSPKVIRHGKRSVSRGYRLQDLA